MSSWLIRWETTLCTYERTPMDIYGVLVSVMDGGIERTVNISRWLLNLFPNFLFHLNLGYLFFYV